MTLVIVLSLLPFVIPLIISLGAIFGLIPLDPSISPRFPIISACVFGFLSSVVLWKCLSPEIRTRIRTLNTTRQNTEGAVRPPWGKRMLLLAFVSFASIGVIIGLLVLDPSPMGLMVGLALWLVLSMVLLMKPMALFTKKTEHSEKLKQEKGRR